MAACMYDGVFKVSWNIKEGDDGVGKGNVCVIYDPDERYAKRLNGEN